MLVVNLDIVDQHGDVVNLTIANHLVKVFEVALVNLSVTDDIDGHVGLTVDERRVGDDVKRHRVKEDIVISLLEASYKLLEVLAHEQISRIRRNSTYTDEVEVIMETTMTNDIMDSVGLSREECAHADIAVLESDIIREASLAQFKVDPHDSFP